MAEYWNAVGVRWTTKWGGCFKLSAAPGQVFF